MMRTSSGKLSLSTLSTQALSKHITSSGKCNMVYRHSISVITGGRQYEQPQFSTIEGDFDHQMPDFAPDKALRSLKRRRAHDDEEEMALFRRVRIKTEIKDPFTCPWDNSPNARTGGYGPDSEYNQVIPETAEASATIVAKLGPERQKPIGFKDAVGRKFSFPFDQCCTWAVSFFRSLSMHAIPC
jgi:hypothetical protein